MQEPPQIVVFGGKIMLRAKIQTTGSLSSSSYFMYQLKKAEHNMPEGTTSKDKGKVVTEQKYSGELNEKWMTHRTDKLILPLHIQFESACKEFQAMCFTGESYKTSCTSQHSQNDTSNNPELKECARRPQPVAQLFRREHSKDWEQHSGIIFASERQKVWSHIQIEKKNWKNEK